MNSETGTLTRRTAKALVLPIDHFTGSRLTHRTFYAAIAPKGTDSKDFDSNLDNHVTCAHTRAGHRTISAAIKCARIMLGALDD